MDPTTKADGSLPRYIRGHPLCLLLISCRRFSQLSLLPPSPQFVSLLPRLTLILLGSTWLFSKTYKFKLGQPASNFRPPSLLYAKITVDLARSFVKKISLKMNENCLTKAAKLIVVAVKKKSFRCNEFEKKKHANFKLHIYAQKTSVKTKQTVKCEKHPSICKTPIKFPFSRNKCRVEKIIRNSN